MYPQLDVARIIGIDHLWRSRMKKSVLNICCRVSGKTVDDTSIFPESKWELMTRRHASPESSMLSKLALLVGAALPPSHLCRERHTE